MPFELCAKAGRPKAKTNRSAKRIYKEVLLMISYPSTKTQ
jgi:hypothetical protein